jgi:hypothetical protein
MKMENEKHSVISLSDESFKHYLIERYAGTQEEASKEKNGWKVLRGNRVVGSLDQNFSMKRSPISKKKAVRVTGYELVNNILLSHDGHSFSMAHELDVGDTIFSRLISNFSNII